MDHPTICGSFPLHSVIWRPVSGARVWGLKAQSFERRPEGERPHRERSRGGMSGLSSSAPPESVGLS